MSAQKSRLGDARAKTRAIFRLNMGGKARARRSMRVLLEEKSSSMPALLPMDRKIRSLGSLASMPVQNSTMTPNRRCRLHAQRVAARRATVAAVTAPQHERTGGSPNSPPSPVHVVSKTRTLVSVSDQAKKDNPRNRRLMP